MTNPAATPTSVTADRPPFSQVPHSLIRDTSLTLSARVVYDDLMARADSDGQCFPGIRTIASDIGVSPGTAQRAVNDLETAGWITVTRQGHKTDGPSKGQRKANRYRVHCEPVPIMDTGAYPLSTQARTDDGYITRTRELEPENNNQLARSAKQTTHDLMVYALVDAMGWQREDVTEPQWNKTHAAAKQLTKIGADPGEVLRRSQVYRVNFRGATMTPNAIATNWADLAEARTPLSARDVENAAKAAARREALASIGGDE